MAGSLQGRLVPGATLERGYGRIVVDAKIGSGAMGSVYRAWLFHPRAQGQANAETKPVPLALKQLSTTAHARASLRALFQNEAEALRRLDHPNVVTFFDLFQVRQTLIGPGADPGELANDPTVDETADDDDASGPRVLPPPPILAMEFIDGDTLESVIARNVARARLAGNAHSPALRPDRAWYYVQQLLGALAASHALGIVHRDVKPSNVLIRKDGLVKLTDFGISHLVTPTHGYRPPTPQELAPGTGAYMSPEQVLGRDLDGRSDLYSAAIVLYEALAGRPPFSPFDTTEFAVRMHQVETPPPSIRTYVPWASHALEQAFFKALAKAPMDRFDSAFSMGEVFRAALGIPATAAWKALGEFADLAAQEQRNSIHSVPRMSTLRQVVSQAFRTQPLQATSTRR